MNINEFDKVKDMNYFDYCDYLKEKYGEAKDYYMTKSFNKKPNITRTKEGLVCHHIKEYEVPKLSTKGTASYYPYEYQAPENLVYCDCLEHLLLHIMIYKQSDYLGVGLGGAVVFMIPQLNDLYSNYVFRQEYMTWLRYKIVANKAVYLKLIHILLEEHYKDIDTIIYNITIVDKKIIKRRRGQKKKKNKRKSLMELKLTFYDTLIHYLYANLVNEYQSYLDKPIDNINLCLEIQEMLLEVILPKLEEAKSLLVECLTLADPTMKDKEIVSIDINTSQLYYKGGN